MRRVLAIVAALAVVLGLALGLARVDAHSEIEVAHISEWKTLADVAPLEPRHELAIFELSEGASLLVELCARGALTPELWGATPMSFELWHRGDGERARTVPLDAGFFELVRGDATLSCVTLADASVPVAGEWSVAVTWQGGAPPEVIAAVPLAVRVLSTSPVGDLDLLAVLLTLLGAALLLVAFLFAPKAESDFDAAAAAVSNEANEPSALAHPAARLALALAVFVAVWLLNGTVFGGGATAAYLGGLTLAGTQVLLAVFLVRRDEAQAAPRSAALGLVLDPGRKKLQLGLVALAPVIGLAAVVVGRMLANLVPSTGVSPIETFVSMTSGLVALATVSVLVPIAEELFFRGFVYGTLAERVGEWGAVGLTVVVFAVVHLPQQWGAWGAVTSVMFLSVVLTVLRKITGSTLVPAVAHVAHNAAITLYSVLAASG